MKKFFRIAAITVFLVGVAVGCTYLLVFRPNSNYVEENKAAMLKTSEVFINCLLGETPSSCGARYASSELQKMMSPTQLEMFGKKIHSNLGALNKLSIIENTLTWNSFTDANRDTKLNINFRTKSVFAQDDAATIDFTFQRTKEWGLLLNGFRINSDQFLK